MSEPTYDALLSSAKNQAAWIRDLLTRLKGHTTRDERGQVFNSFAAATVPDWELRQNLQWLEDTLEGKPE